MFRCKTKYDFKVLQTFAYKIRIFIWKYSCTLKYQTLESYVESLPKDLDIMLRYAFENGTDIDFLCIDVMKGSKSGHTQTTTLVVKRERETRRKGENKEEWESSFCQNPTLMDFAYLNNIYFKP